MLDSYKTIDFLKLLLFTDLGQVLKMPVIM